MHWIYLRSARLKLHITQAQLAKRARVLQHTVSKLETTSNARPPYTTHTRLARALDVDPDRLRFGPDPQSGLEQDLRRGRRDMIPHPRPAPRRAKPKPAPRRAKPKPAPIPAAVDTTAADPAPDHHATSTV